MAMLQEIWEEINKCFERLISTSTDLYKILWETVDEESCLDSKCVLNVRVHTRKSPVSLDDFTVDGGVRVTPFEEQPEVQPDLVQSRRIRQQGKLVRQNSGFNDGAKAKRRLQCRPTCIKDGVFRSRWLHCMQQQLQNLEVIQYLLFSRKNTAITTKVDNKFINPGGFAPCPQDRFLYQGGL